MERVLGVGEYRIMDTGKIHRLIDLAMMDRRSFNRYLGSLGLGLMMLPLAAGRGRAAGNITYFTWAGYEVPELHPSFVEKYGGSPEISFFEEEETALTKLRRGFAVDVAHPCSSSVMKWYDAGVLKPIDTTRLAHWPDIIDALKRLPGTSAGDQTLYIPTDWGSNSVAYRTDQIDPEYIENPSWRVMLDERYRNHLAMWDSVDGAVAMAAAIAGVKDTANATDDEIGQITDILRKVHDLALFYWTSETELEASFAQGEITAAYFWSGPVYRLQEQGVPVDYMQNPEEGVVSFCCGLVLIAAGQGDETAAYDFIDAWSSPEAGKYLVEVYGYGHSNRRTYEIVDPGVLKSHGLEGDVDAFLAKTSFFQYWSPAVRDQWVTIFEDVKTGF